MIGSIIGNRYEITEKVSQGASSEIWNAIDRRENKAVIVKLVKDSNLNSMIDEEASLLKKIEHPNIIKFVDKHTIEDRAALIIEKIKGPNLSEIVERNTSGSDPQFALSVAQDMISALNELHKNGAEGIIHKDIKPANIVYCEETKKSILIDFGISAYQDYEGKYISSFEGYTPPYSSPELWIPTNDEQIAYYDSKKYSKENDIFALGLTIYELLAGRPAHSWKKTELINMLYYGQIPPIEERVKVSAELANVFRRWLSPNPKDRFENLDMLTAYIENTPEYKGYTPLKQTQVNTTETIFDFENTPGNSLTSVYPNSYDLERAFFGQQRLTESNDKERNAIVKFKERGHFVFEGVPGSGKSYCLIQRAIWLSNKYPDWKIVIVCFNNNLIKYLEKTYLKIISKDNSMEQLSLLKTGRITFATKDKLAKDESGVKGRVQNWDEMRELAFVKATPKYDAILVDEYQDFDEKEIKFLKRLCKRHTNKYQETFQSMTFTGDKAQTVISTRSKEKEWKALGIEVTKGRNRYLTKSFRLTKTVLELSKKLSLMIYPLKQREKMEEFASHELAHRGRLILKQGKKEKALKEVLLTLEKNNIAPSDILVINTVKESENRAIKADIARLYPGVRVEAFLTTKGLEAPVVVILNASSIMDNYQYGNQHCRKERLYTMMTRSSHTLIVHDESENSTVFKMIKSIKQKKVA